MTFQLTGQSLPEHVCIDNVAYKINCDFQTSVQFEIMMQSDRLHEEEKATQALALYFPKIPSQVDLAFEALVDFYRCGQPPPPISEGGGTQNQRAYSFEHDGPHIYAAFMQQYGIDIMGTNMHWWKFRALFNALTDETLFVKIMGWRTAKISSKLSAEEKRSLARLKAAYALPKIQQKDETTCAIESILRGSGNLKSILSHPCSIDKA